MASRAYVTPSTDRCVGEAGSTPASFQPTKGDLGVAGVLRLVEMLGRVADLRQREVEAATTRAGCTSDSSRRVDPYMRAPAYSKRLDLVSELVNAAGSLRAKDAREPETARSVRSGQAPRVWRVSDRLSEATCAAWSLATAPGRRPVSLPNSSTSARAASSGSYANGAFGGQPSSRDALTTCRRLATSQPTAPTAPCK
jgi:hypothetical protein